MPGADDLMMRIYAAMAQKEHALISERTRAALATAKARGAVLGGDRGYRPSVAPCAQQRPTPEWTRRTAPRIELGSRPSGCSEVGSRRSSSSHES